MNTVIGGAFLLEIPEEYASFTPEDYTEEQQLLRSAVRDFLDREIEPSKDIFDSQAGTELAPVLLEKLGELGYLGLAVPQEYGGFGCDMKTDLVVSEVMADSFAFSQSLGVQRGLGINTILFYGNPAQRKKYLAGIIAGKTKCSYCLTEPQAGSDANAGKTRATLSPDGKHYLLNGQKMWITNAGFADVFSVFCKIEDDPKLSCLIVEKEWGVTLGAEEKKLGIHGSSTRQVFFDNVKVPVENLLGERNKGFKIAMNALNMGRLMIGVAGTSIGKRAFRLAVSYANERVQFGRPIATFGAIKEKIAKMAMELYALESSWHRLIGDMDQLAEQHIAKGANELGIKQKVASEFAAECAIIKVLGSEAESFVVDEALQIHGGMGYSGESEISVHYRNVRGNRIYEGTNEINRLIITGELLKKGLSGELPFMQEVMKTNTALLMGQLNTSKIPFAGLDSIFSYVGCLKKVILLITGKAMRKYQEKLKYQQQLLSRISDLIAHLYFIESSALRCKKHPSELKLKLTYLYILEKSPSIVQSVEEVIARSTDPENIAKDTRTIVGLLSFAATDVIALRTQIADHFISQNHYRI